MDAPDPRKGQQVDRFETTRWSLVLAARDNPARSAQALDGLCRTYRAAVVDYVRSRGHSLDEAEDLTQSFFARFVEHAHHARADPARGRFRAFLLTALKNFLNDAFDHANALKRGGGAETQSLALLAAEADSAPLEDDAESPERAFERAWARAVLQSAVDRLRDEAAGAGKSALFDQLREFLVERPDETDYARIAQALNLRRNTIAVAVHRLRNRLREFVCAELAETAADEGNLEQELADLRHCLGSVLQPKP